MAKGNENILKTHTYVH